MSDTKPPRRVLHPDYPPDLDQEAPSGLHPATRDFVREVNKSGVWKVAVAVGSFALMCLLAGVGGARAIAQEAHDAGVQAAEGHETRLKALEQQVPQLRDEVFQGRLDTQALYKAVTDHKRQERLEHPPAPPSKDGGP